jgi:uncharacterized Zn finger protein
MNFENLVSIMGNECKGMKLEKTQKHVEKRFLETLEDFKPDATLQMSRFFHREGKSF